MGSTRSLRKGALSATQSVESSPPSSKRNKSELSPDHGSSSKRLKPSPSPNEKDRSSTTCDSDHSDSTRLKINKQTWQGFCEIESDPVYFSVLLREMGVQGITVREVFAMDPMLLETLPQPIHGLILLFNYREFGNSDQAAECPRDVWFANQLPAQDSCATLAMINILMNSSKDSPFIGNVQLGEHLNEFKSFTSEFTPFQRGEALASFDFVKKIHNSFAKEMDILEGDKYLSYKAKRAAGKKKEAEEKIVKRGTKSRKRRDASADSAATNDSAEGYEQSAHHYIAFVPVGNEVWKLDGLDAQPTSMGTFDIDAGETWLSAVSDTIAALMAAGDDDYGVIALTQSPLVSLRKEAHEKLNHIIDIEEKINKQGSSKTYDILTDQAATLRTLGIEASTSETPSHTPHTSDNPDQLDNHTAQRENLIEQLNQLEASIMSEMQAELEEDQKAAMRRFDSGPLIKVWLEMLAENGHLEENLDRFMTTGKKGGG